MEQPTQLDPQIVNLTKAIRQTETGGNFTAKGGSGEYGAYQFTAPTWQNLAGKYLGDANIPLQSATPQQQNEVAYKQVADWKGQGYNIGQIASLWNSGKPDAYLDPNYTGTNKYGVKYDVPAYVKSVATAYQTIKAGGQTNVDPNNPSSIAGTQYGTPQTQPNQSGATFPSSASDSPITAGLKTFGNIPSSAFNFVKGIVNTFNPIKIAENISQIPGAFNDLSQQRGGALNALGATATQLPQTAYQAVVPEAARALVRGDLPGAQAAVTNDPVGSIAPFLLGADQATKFADEKLGTNSNTTLDNAISTTAKTAVKPIAAVTSVPGSLLGGIVRSATSHILGLEPADIATILKNPEAFSKVAQDQVSRGGLANEFGGAIDQLEGTLQETGQAYNPIRSSEMPAVLPENFIGNVLDKFGLKLEPILKSADEIAKVGADGLPTIDYGIPKESQVKGYKVVADTNSITRNTSDIKAIQNFVDNWGDKTNLTPAEYLNMRKDIAGMAKFGKEIGTNIDAQKVGTELYAEANRSVRPQIQGLKELDEQYSPLRQQFDQAKKDFLTKQSDGSYEFKQGAINKIANATGVGKDALLSRMEEILPGIKKKIEILKAVEGIEKAYGNKVGNYTKGIIEGGAVLTGNIPAVIAAIISNPTIAVPLIRGLGLTAAKIAPIVSTLKLVAGDVNHLKIPETVKPFLAVPNKVAQ